MSQSGRLPAEHRMKVGHAHPPPSPAAVDGLLAEIRRLVAGGELILGAELERFEGRFAALLGAGQAIGVGSGTDAVKLSLKALEVGPGDEVITAANADIGTVGAIAELGARPVFVDCTDFHCIDVDRVPAAVTPRTRAIVPVHATGNVADMPTLCALAARRGLAIVEEASQALLGSVDGRIAGTWGRTGAFSLHPPHALSVWGDGGVIVTSETPLAEKLRLLRNQGLSSAGEARILGCLSRLDTLQAVVVSSLLGNVEAITAARIASAEYYDVHLRQLDGITIPPRLPARGSVFGSYVVLARDRDALARHCRDRGIAARPHDPVPVYRQPALAFLGHKPGDFPMTDHLAAGAISFPCHQDLGRAELDLVIETVASFYRRPG
jgi:dTDP-4-amino-4,6-dideoxygalactose transaminase